MNSRIAEQIWFEAIEILKRPSRVNEASGLHGLYVGQVLLVTPFDFGHRLSVQIEVKE